VKRKKLWNRDKVFRMGVVASLVLANLSIQSRLWRSVADRYCIDYEADLTRRDIHIVKICNNTIRR